MSTTPKQYRSSDEILGFVLTLSPLAGVGMVDKRTLQEMQSRPGTRAARDDTSFLGSFMDKYAASGIAGWPTKSTLWFVVMLLTELLATPRKNSSGIPVPSIQRAYIPTIRDLVSSIQLAVMASVLTD